MGNLMDISNFIKKSPPSPKILGPLQFDSKNPAEEIAAVQKDAYLLNLRLFGDYKLKLTLNADYLLSPPWWGFNSANALSASVFFPKWNFSWSPSSEAYLFHEVTLPDQKPYNLIPLVRLEF